VCRRRDAYRVLAGKPEGKNASWKTRHRLEDNVELNLREIGWEEVGYCLAEDRLM
jgi:hypothetical protein